MGPGRPGRVVVFLIPDVFVHTARVVVDPFCVLGPHVPGMSHELAGSISLVVIATAARFGLKGPGLTRQLSVTQYSCATRANARHDVQPHPFDVEMITNSTLTNKLTTMTAQW